MNIKLSINPVPKPRMTRRDKWLNPPRPAVARYWLFADELRLCWRQTGLDSLPPAFDVVFYLPMPDGWSKAKKDKMRGKPHQVKPDRDNLIKSVQDVLCKDDAYIYDGRVGKFWADSGAIVIKVA